MCFENVAAKRECEPAVNCRKRSPSKAFLVGSALPAPSREPTPAKGGETHALPSKPAAEANDAGGETPMPAPPKPEKPNRPNKTYKQQEPTAPKEKAAEKKRKKNDAADLKTTLKALPYAEDLLADLSKFEESFECGAYC